MKEPLLLYNPTNPYMTIFDEIHAHLVHHTDLPIDHHIDAISLLYIDHAQIQEKTIQQYTSSYRAPSRPRVFLDPDHILKQKQKKHSNR